MYHGVESRVNVVAAIGFTGLGSKDGEKHALRIPTVCPKV